VKEIRRHLRKVRLGHDARTEIGVKKGQIQVTSQDLKMDQEYGGLMRAAVETLRSTLGFIVDTYPWLFHQNYSIMVTYFIMAQNTF
jgi:hypothetical protein